MSSTRTLPGAELLAANKISHAESAPSVVSLVRDPDQICLAWETLWASNTLLDTGFFHPAFSRAVMRVREDVEFAVVEKGNEIVAILPFQRVGKSVAHPVGGLMSDFHGLLADESCKLDYRSLLNRCRLRHLHFHALKFAGASTESSSIKRVFRTLKCPFIDLSQGSQHYRNWVRRHSSTVKRQPQKTRAMARKLGPVRVEYNCRDPQALETLIAWKRARFQRTRTFDLLGVDWTSNLLREVFQDQEPDFKGVLSVLWAGDTMVAGHFGFVCNNVLHYWIPAHSHEQRRFSPGTQLMIELTGNAERFGIHRIDLGYGESDLKTRFANDATQVEVGCFDSNPVSRFLHHSRYEVRQSLKKIPAKESLKKIVRPLFPNLGKGNFR